MRVHSLETSVMLPSVVGALLALVSANSSSVGWGGKKTLSLYLEQVVVLKMR